MTIQDAIKYFRKIPVDAENEGSRKDTAFRLYNNAILLVKAGRYEEACRDLKDAIRRIPNFDDAYALLGLTQFALGDSESSGSLNRINSEIKRGQAIKLCGMMSRGTEGRAEGTNADVGGGAGKASLGDGLQDNNGAGTEKTEFTAPHETSAGKTDFRKRFEQAQKSAEQSRYSLDLGRNGSPAGRQGTVRPAGRETSRYEGPAVRTERVRTANQNAGSLQSIRQDRIKETRQNASPDSAPADSENVKDTDSAKKPPKKAGKTVLLALVTIVSIALIGSIAALAVKLHDKYLSGGGTPSATQRPAPSRNPSTPTPKGEYTTPSPAETETASPAETQPAESETPTKEPEPTPTPTPDPAQVAAEQAQRLSYVKELLSGGNYTDCFETAMKSDWSALDSAKAAELEEIRKAAFPEYYKVFRNAVGVAEKHYNATGKNDVDEWKRALECAELLLACDPDYRDEGALYFNAGKGADVTGDKAKASYYYKETMSRFPGTKNAEYAKYRNDALAN